MATLADYSSTELPPEGFAHPAVLVEFIDFGVQEGKFKPSRHAQLSFELLDEKTSKGKPVLAHKRVFNLNPRSKNFREDLRALTGLHDISTIDPRDLLGRECLLAIEHTTTENGTFADIEIKPLKGKPTGRKPATEPLFFSLHPSDFDEGALNDLPEWMHDKVVKSPTYADLMAQREATGKTTSEIVSDEIPFG